MRIPRLSIARLMGVVLVASLALAALRSGSATWAGATFLVTCGVLMLAVVGAVCREGKERAWWLGFAFFGWGYLQLVFRARDYWELPTTSLLELFRPRFGIPPSNDFAYCRVGHCLFGLAAAGLGGLAAVGLLGLSTVRWDRVATGPESEDRPVRRRWRRPAVVGLAGFVAACGLGLIGLRSAPRTAAAVASFGVWGLLALAIVGAIFGPRGRRAAWLGAALFGVGYLVMPYHLPHQPDWARAVTDDLLRAARVRLGWIIGEAPPPVESAAEANASVLKALEQPIVMTFPQETPLEDVLKYIKSNTVSEELYLPSGIPIYVDPLALQAVGKTLQSPVVLDVDRVPLRTSLRLILEQLRLKYGVYDGVLLITSEEVADPFLAVGHCLLAGLAAGLGGLLAPRVCK